MPRSDQGIGQRGPAVRLPVALRPVFGAFDMRDTVILTREAEKGNCMPVSLTTGNWKRHKSVGEATGKFRAIVRRKGIGHKMLIRMWVMKRVAERRPRP